MEITDLKRYSETQILVKSLDYRIQRFKLIDLLSIFREKLQHAFIDTMGILQANCAEEAEERCKNEARRLIQAAIRDNLVLVILDTASKDFVDEVIREFQDVKPRIVNLA